MKKIEVIDVDLGQNIDDIISEDVEELAEQTKEAIDEAIAKKREVETRQTQRTQEKARKELQIREALERVYTGLLEATERESFLGLEEMAELAKPAITNTSALILQLKSFIRKHKDNAYVPKRRTKDGRPIYTLIPFNVES